MFVDATLTIQDDNSHRHAVMRSRTHVSALLVIAAAIALPQNCNAGPLEAFAQALTRLHIGLTKSDLTEALRNPDIEVRGLAAAQLAETKEKDCLPQILEALQVERDPQAKVNLASAAAQLGAREGMSVLEEICHSPSEPGWARTNAGRYLSSKGNRACMDDLWSLMQPGMEASNRIASIGIVSQMRDLTAQEKDRVLHLTIEALQDQDMQLRIVAASTLKDLNNTAAVPFLQIAIQAEKEEPIRSAMQSALQSLLRSRPPQ
jgi:HEAT repeat protein